MLGAGAGLSLSNASFAATSGIPAAPPQVTLGKTGITTSRLALGTGVSAGKLRSKASDKGFADFVELFEHAYERGINFFDLAEWYGSHVYFREALRQIPREKVTILSKFWWRNDGNNVGELPVDFRSQSARKALTRFKQELQTDYIDILLLHCLMKPDWTEDMQPYMDVFSEAKAKGELKALGVSCHNFGAMETAVDSPWVDVILARLNPAEVAMDASPEKVIALLAKAKAKGIGVIGMKVYGNGKLVERREECMRYAQNHGVFDAMTIGMLSKEQIDENLELMAKYPVSRERLT
jgi:1-deoxyxylulose-5-phosphate synthase